MLEGDEWKRDYDHKDDESPMAKMFRNQEAHEAAIHAEIVKLHASLPAKSSDLDLFTFTEIKQWGLKHTRKRAKETE